MIESLHWHERKMALGYVHIYVYKARATRLKIIKLLHISCMFELHWNYGRQDYSKRLPIYISAHSKYIYHIILIHINNSISITSRKLFHLQILFLVKCTHKSMIGYTKMQTRKWGARENTKMSKQIETVTNSIEPV